VTRQKKTTRNPFPLILQAAKREGVPQHTVSRLLFISLSTALGPHPDTYRPCRATRKSVAKYLHRLKFLTPEEQLAVKAILGI